MAGLIVAAMVLHTVIAGDTLGEIASDHGTTVATLARDNAIPNPDLIYVGQRIQIRPQTAPTPLERPPEPATDVGRWAATTGACIRSIESDTAGGYSAVSPGGTYRGAYQMDNDFWRTYGGDPAYTGRHERAPVAMQDAVAYRGYLARGLQPWPTPAWRCR